MKPITTISKLRSQLNDRRTIRQFDKSVAAELASFTSPAEQLELEAMISRLSADEIAELDAMLTRGATSRVHA